MTTQSRRTSFATIARAPLMALATAGAILAFGTAAQANEPTVIELTQTGCQFLEPEGMDHGYKTMSKADCEAINGDSGAKRLADVEPLVLKPGKYIFRVTNKNVPYDLGYYLRAASTIKIPFQPKVSGGGLKTGVTKDYVIELTEGEYVYSCPLNPTPDYPIIVKN